MARDDAHGALCEALESGTLHEWGAVQPGARAMRGRGVTWATALPSGPRVAIRHSRHGGLFAAITRDLFVAPTRAPRELARAIRLAAAGVRTPAVIGYAIYGVTGPLCRADVVTELLDGEDLVAALRAPDANVDEIASAVRALLDALSAARATHHDLNARNILLTPTGAAVLDVDRVTFGSDRHPTTGRHVVRLGQSLMKIARQREIPPDAAFRMVTTLGPAPRRPSL